MISRYCHVQLHDVGTSAACMAPSAVYGDKWEGYNRNGPFFMKAIPSGQKRADVRVLCFLHQLQAVKGLASQTSIGGAWCY